MVDAEAGGSYEAMYQKLQMLVQDLHQLVKAVPVLLDDRLMEVRQQQEQVLCFMQQLCRDREEQRARESARDKERHEAQAAHRQQMNTLQELITFFFAQPPPQPPANVHRGAAPKPRQQCDLVSLVATLDLENPAADSTSHDTKRRVMQTSQTPGRLAASGGLDSNPFAPNLGEGGLLGERLSLVRGLGPASQVHSRPRSGGCKPSPGVGAGRENSLSVSRSGARQSQASPRSPERLSQRYSSI